MSSTLIKKLEHSGFLTDADRELLASAFTPSRSVGAREDLIREDDRPENVLLIFDGFACRYKLMPKGRRHIMALLVPGDFCDLHVAILGHMDHSISTITPCEVCEISRAAVQDLTDNHPRIARALWWATLTDEGTLREWLANMGQRDSNRQMAHFLCELLVRMQTIGHATDNSCEFPLTQNELADVLGRSNVHVNRSLQELRGAGLLELKGKRLTMDVERIQAYCSFNPNYLHLTPRKNGLSPDLR